MIVQKVVTEKTGTGTLTYGNIGDIVTTSAEAIVITLPAPSKGLWYRISNAGEGEVSVVYDSIEITTIAQEEAVLLLSNGSSGWWYSKGGGGGPLTKEAIEAVLTGEITSHVHPLVAGGSGLVIDPNHIFADNTARDDYFVANPEELTRGIFVSVGAGFQQWDGSIWIDKTAMVTGADGMDGADGLDGDIGPVGPAQPRPTDIQYYADGFIVTFADESIGNYSWVRDGNGQITNITNVTADPDEVLNVGYHIGNRP